MISKSITKLPSIACMEAQLKCLGFPRPTSRAVSGCAAGRVPPQQNRRANLDIGQTFCAYCNLQSLQRHPDDHKNCQRTQRPVGR